MPRVEHFPGPQSGPGMLVVALPLVSGITPFGRHQPSWWQKGDWNIPRFDLQRIPDPKVTPGPSLFLNFGKERRKPDHFSGIKARAKSGQPLPVVLLHKYQLACGSLGFMLRNDVVSSLASYSTSQSTTFLGQNKKQVLWGGHM